MSDEKKKKSANEIVDQKAAEMGVDKKKVPSTDESAEHVMAGLGGVFDVPVKKKKKKEAPKVEEVVEEEEEEATPSDDADDAEDSVDDGEEEEEVPEPPKKASKTPEKSEKKSEKKTEKPVAKTEKPAAKSDKPKKKLEGVDLFVGGDDEAPKKASKKSAYLEQDDLGDLDPPQKSNTMLYVGVGVATLVIGLGAIFAFGDVQDIMALFSGDLRERRLAEKERIEEEFRQKELAELEKFGNLMISGNPQYAMVKVNGQLQYGQTSSGEWRELQLGPSTAFQNLNIKNPYNIEITAPGFQPLNIEITQGKWQETPSGDFSFTASPNLTPVSMDAKMEFDTRLAPDVETEYFGTISINTMPAGAKVIFNNHPLLNEKGEELRTPVKFDKYYVKDEKTGKLEERNVNVDSILDQGHKVQLEMPAESGEFPKYVTALQRQNWTCNWKSEAELKAIKFNAEKDSIQKKCNYTWDFTLDFNNLKKFIADQEAERKRVEEKNKEIQEAMAKAKEEAQK